MQTLHLVGFTTELDGLIFSARKGSASGSYVVPLDRPLLQQIAEAERRRGDGRGPGSPRLPRSVRPESALSPRQMQDRIRAGWSLEDVAAEAGVDLDWVSRFAAPVHAEIRRVVDRARHLVYDKQRVGPSALPLGASVRRNVGERGVRLVDDDAFDDGWSAYQLDKDLWMVCFAYTSRGRPQEAEWQLDLETGELTSRNRIATQLGHVTKAAAKPPASLVPAPPARAPKGAHQAGDTESLPGL